MRYINVKVRNVQVSSQERVDPVNFTVVFITWDSQHDVIKENKFLLIAIEKQFEIKQK